MNFLIWQHCAVLFLSLGFAIYLVPFFMQTAFRLGVLDVPDGGVKKHKNPTPYMGGLAIYLAFTATIGLLYGMEERIMWLITGATLLMLVGFIDDLKRLKPSRKIWGQLLGIACFLHGGLLVTQGFFTAPLNFLITGFWMLLVINAINLIDVMDGLSASVSVVAAAGFFFIALLFGQYAVSLVLLAFIGSLAGFFWFNKPAAKIYMGDAGALFIGGFLSAIPLLMRWPTGPWDMYFISLIVLAIPLLEVTSLVIIRTYKGIPFYKGSPHHFSIYLQNKGWSKWGVLAFSTGMGCYASLFAALYLKGAVSPFALCGAGGIFLLVWCIAVFSSAFTYPESKVEKILAAKRDSTMNAKVSKGQSTTEEMSQSEALENGVQSLANNRRLE